MLMISFNTVDYRSSIQPVMKVIKFAAYNTKYFFAKRKPARNAVRREENEYFANYWKKTENSPVKCES